MTTRSRAHARMWLCAAILLIGCARTRTIFSAPEPGAAAGSGAQGSTTGDPDDPAQGSMGSGTPDPAQPGGIGTSPGAVPGGPGRPGAGPTLPGPTVPGPDPTTGTPAGTGVTGMAGTGIGPIGGASGGSAPVPQGPENPDALDVLNPQRCAADQSFVLAIHPGGSSGEVQGWLESAPTVVFDERFLPRFGQDDFEPDAMDDELMLWWSIARLETKTLWMYALNPATEIAHVPVTDVAAIGDARSLMYLPGNDGLASVGEVQMHEITLLHHLPTDRFVAIQVFDMYGYEGGQDPSLCAAIDARWFLAPAGTADFSVFR